MNPNVAVLNTIGQSLWYDNIRRTFLMPGGEMAMLIAERSVVGVTSNPSIFEKAIAASGDYDAEFQTLVQKGASADDIYQALVEGDIRLTADLLHPIYLETQTRDGYVSVEVSPNMAHNTEGTIQEGLHLYQLIQRPNVMIKVPGTEAGVPAIRALTEQGVSVNVTLLFSLSQYEAIATAYIEGLEARLAAGKPLTSIASVASFFVSRVDTLIDKVLETSHSDRSEALRGKAAIANAKLAYELGNKLFSGPRWEKLAAAGAQAQRLLWASTSTKDPRYKETLYVDELIGRDTVNTVPPATLKAFLKSGNPRNSLVEGLEAARAHVAVLEGLGISLEAVGVQLQKEGVAAFAQAMNTLMDAIRTRREAALRG